MTGHGAVGDHQSSLEKPAVVCVAVENIFTCDGATSAFQHYVNPCRIYDFASLLPILQETKQHAIERGSVISPKGRRASDSGGF